VPDQYLAALANALLLLKCGKRRDIDLVIILEAFIHFEDTGDELHAGMASQLAEEVMKS
jgi:hypothetical protein